MTLIWYPKCSTCRKAQAFLDAAGAQYDVRDITQQNPTAEELRDWQKRSGLSLRKFFNSSGMKYRELGLKDALPTMSEEEQLQVLASDGMLVKRPILLAGEQIVIGFRESNWAQALDAVTSE